MDLRVACCGVLQRRHNSDTVLKRLGSRHACELTLNWLGTATRNSISDDSLCGHLPVPRQCRSRLNSKLQKIPKKWTPTSEGLAGSFRSKNTTTCSAAYSAESRRQLYALPLPTLTPLPSTHDQRKRSRLKDERALAGSGGTAIIFTARRLPVALEQNSVAFYVHVLFTLVETVSVEYCLHFLSARH